MGKLTILFGARDGDATGAPLPAEVIGENLAVVDRVTLRVGEEEHVSLDPGTYLVRAELPSGRVVKESAVVEAKRGARVDLGTVRSQHEWTQPAVLLGDIADRDAPPGPRLDARPGLWLVDWVRGARGWRERPWPPVLVGSDDHHLAYDMPPGRGALQMIQYGATGVPWRLVALPPSPQPVRVVLTPTEEPEGLTCSVSTREHDADMLLRYLAAGDMRAADVTGEPLQASLRRGLGSGEATAERFARRKTFDPGSAAIGFYHLFRVRADDKLRDWPGNFARWFPWIPDAHVIRGWQALRANDAKSKRVARTSLLAATEAGVPVFTEGLQLLLEGLHMLARDAGADVRDHARLAAAAERVSTFAAAADLEQPFTTFRGTRPDAPGRDAPAGAPFGLRHVHAAFSTSPAAPARDDAATARLDAFADRDVAPEALRDAAGFQRRYLEDAVAAMHSVGRVVVRGAERRIEAEATGALVSPNLVLTAGHALPDADAARRASVELATLGPGGAPKALALDPDRFFVADPALDFTVVAIRGGPQPAFTRLASDPMAPFVGQRLTAVHPPVGERQHVELRAIAVAEAGDDGVRFAARPLGGRAGVPLFDDGWTCVAMVRLALTSEQPGGDATSVGEATPTGHILAALRQRVTTAEHWALVGELLQSPALGTLRSADPGPVPAGPSPVAAPPGSVATVQVSVPFEITVRTPPATAESPPPPPEQAG